ncbi:Alpha/Beta hydrolase protein [Fennellomyces sp. T-0311]|nr:Alpha/Beta hydrolase protein [Fennellomyces sp. T-0311]
MARLEPTQVYTIPVHPSAHGYDVLQLVVEKHVFPATCSPARLDIAYLWSHGTGFHKEILHPLMRRTIAKLRSLPNYDYVNIDFIAWDMRNHGDSARLNQGLYNDAEPLSWFDIAMDVTQIADKLKFHDYDKVIGVGHSSGATAMLLAEAIHPKIFDGYYAIESIVRNYIPKRARKAQLPIIKRTPKRRDTWSDREACYKDLLRSPFWQKLHPEAVQNYLDYGLYDAEDGTVKLKCTRVQESLQHDGDMYPVFMAFSSLKSLSIPTHFVYCTEPASGTTLVSDAQDIKKQSPLITLSKLEGTHMLPAECPDMIVPEIVQLTERVCGRFYTAKL